MAKAKTVAKPAAPAKTVAKPAAKPATTAKPVVAAKPAAAVKPAAKPAVSKSKVMTKAQIIDHLATKTGTTKKVALTFMTELVALAYKEAKKSFVLPGLGKLEVSSRKKRKGRNPLTGAEIVIPAKKVLKFKIAKAAKDAVFPAK
ncbi:MAG: HU family DNA-binding protein [Methanococcaceae archaeon]